MRAGATGQRWSRAVGLTAGFMLDRLLGDPRRHHPVAWFGTAAQQLEQRTYRDAIGAGAAHTGMLVGAVTLGGLAVEKLCARSPLAHAAATALATWMVLGGRSLEHEVSGVAAHLQAGELEAARHQLRNLVARDPWALDAGGVARAAIESLAENTSDAVTAPLWWGGVCGLPGLLGYRAINTLDAMIGYRNARYEWFGKAAAKLDDVVNWVPARIGTALAAGRSGSAWRAVREDAQAHPSPNGGRIEAAFAGALGIQLGGTNTYGGITEDRGVLGDGRPAQADDAARAVRLGRRVQIGSLAVAVVAAVVTWRARATPDADPKVARRTRCGPSSV